MIGDIGLKHMEFIPDIIPVLITVLKDGTPAVTRQAITCGIDLFCSTLVKVAIQGLYSSELDNSLESSWAWVLKFRDEIYLIAFQPGSDGTRLLALKFVEAIILLYTPDPKPPPHQAFEGKFLEFNMSRLRRGHPVLNVGDLSIEASQALGLLLDQLWFPTVKSLSNSMIIVLINSSMAATRSSPRTPSKHKGVGQLPTEGLPDYIDLSHKASWDSESTEIFLECVREQILSGRRLGTTISLAGYKEIAVQFAKRTGRRHDVKQFKNKYLGLKKEWQAWNKLMDTTKGVTGIGFDRSTGLFTASDEWWENLKTTNKLAYKFKTKPLEHEDLMREVFTSATATGKHHWTPGEHVVDIADADSDSTESPGLQPFTAPYQPVADSPPPSPIVQVDETEQGSKRKKGASSSGKSKKPSTGASVLADSFNHLSDAVRSQKHLTIRHGTGASQKYGIEACMQRIMAIPDFISTPLFHFACIALENADYREILMCIPDDGNVVGWLAALKVAKGL